MFANFIVIFLLICANAINCNGQDSSSPSAQEFLDVLVQSPYPTPGPDPVESLVPAGDRTEDLLNQRYNLSEISAMCPKSALYSSFHPDHSKAVTILTGYFEQQRTSREFIDFARDVKNNTHIHPKVWYAAFSRARLSVPLPALDAINFPNPFQLFPSTFFPNEVIQETENSPQKCVTLDERFGADNGIENQLWYFREDVQLNGHHWVWHLLNPWNFGNITRAIDRRGEFFSFFHHDLLARYTAERLSLGFPLQKPLNLKFDTILEEGYNSHLTDAISERTYPPRRSFAPFYESLTAVEKEIFKSVIAERDRVIDAITQGGILHENGFLEINAFDRVNVLGDILEASHSSVNTKIYGMAGFHNNGHDIISYVDAPRAGNTTEDVPRDAVHGVMGSVETTMRDIIFYRWHKSVDLIFQSYKLTHLKAYTPNGGEYPLVFKGINVNAVQVIPQNCISCHGAVNHLETFWKIRSFDLQSGIDFKQKRSLNICAKHLDHQEFEYRINVVNELLSPKLATVRIFLAPRYKSIKQNIRYTMLEQRTLFFTMDSFQTVLQPGQSVLVRQSIDSTLTTDWPKSFKEIQDEIRNGTKLRPICDCGFPQHLLLPKGTPTGMTFDLFVMITDGLQDQVKNDPNSPPARPTECPIPSHIHCGIRGSKYPDSKPMGYPFDRKPYTKQGYVTYANGQVKPVQHVVKDIEDYVADIPNMHVSQIVIHHHNEVR